MATSKRVRVCIQKTEERERITKKKKKEKYTEK